MVAYDQVILSMESRGGSLPQKSSDEWRAELRPRQNIGQSFSPQAAHIQQLQEKLSETQQQLEKETRRAQLLEQELEHLRSLTLLHTERKSASSSAANARPEPEPGQQAAKAHVDQPDHNLQPQPRRRAQSIDGKPSSVAYSPVEVHRMPSAPTQKASPMRKPGSMDRAIKSALHAVSGAYLKEQAAQQSSSLQKRQQAMSEAESKVHEFIEQAQPVLLQQTSSTVTISKQAFELLVLKDRAINAVKEGITIADCSLPDHPLIFTNAAFSKITGYSREEVLGKNCRFLQGPGTDDGEIAKMREAASEGKPSVVQLLNYKKNGDPFINYLSITPIHDSKGHVTHFMGIQSDISDLVNHKKAELAAKHEAAQAAAATEVKSQFLARMSHEIRTPLNGMIAVGQLLAETILSPAQWDLMNTIRCSGETLLTLITDILDFSRIEADKMELNPSEFHLQTVIEAAMEIAGLHAAQKRLQVAYNVADNVPKLVTCDAQRLQQVLLNVLNNAVKFTEKGEILLEVWCEPQEDADLNQSAKQAQQQLHADPFNRHGQANGSEACKQQPEPLLGHVSKDTGQCVALDSPALEMFRPLTPDNLSQHTELAEMRQQVQGPAPSFATGNNAALAASFNTCEGGGHCSCPPGQEDSKVRCSNLACAALRQQTLSTESAAKDGHASILPGPLEQAQPVEAQQQTSKHQPSSPDTFTSAPAAQTTAGQQRVLATSSASAEAGSAADRPADGPADGPAPCAGATSDNIAGEAAQQREKSYRRQAMDCSQERMGSRRSNSQASTSGRSGEDAAQYTINFSVRDSGIGISAQNLTDLFQCFCQVDASPTRRFGGSGLGLAISKKLTEAMGGHMWVESDGLGKGSIFRWTLQARGYNSIAPRIANNDKGGHKAAEALSTTRSNSSSSKGSGHRQLQPTRSSTEWQPSGRSMSGSTVESGLASFAGKKVLLVEICDMVRQVLALALRRWGFQVCAVKNEADAVTKLKLRDGHSDFLAACKRRAEGKLFLEHSHTDVCSSSLSDVEGPFDVVILDMALSQLVLAIMQGVKAEAHTLVFLGWPGQNEPEEDALHTPLDTNGPALASPKHSQGNTCYQDALPGLSLGSGAISAQMSQDTAEKMSNGPTGSKKLMYGIVTRPVRQGRLKLALEEVLSSQLDPNDASKLQSPHAAATTAPVDTNSSSTPSHQLASSTGLSQSQDMKQTPPGQDQDSPRQNGNAPHLDGYAPVQLASLHSRQDSRMSSGHMSNASSASGNLLPSPSDLAPLQSLGSNPSLHGADSEFPLNSRRHSLQRAPKLKGHGSRSELAALGATRRSLKVLLAEDNLINMKVALGILNRTGYSEVTTVVDGQQAMDELHRRGGADAFDIILTDLHMPHKGGMEMVTEIRQLWPKSKVKVVAVTADAFEDRRDQCLASGFDGWLAKPFRVEDLVKIIEAVS